MTPELSQGRDSTSQPSPERCSKRGREEKEEGVGNILHFTHSHRTLGTRRGHMRGVSKRRDAGQKGSDPWLQQPWAQGDALGPAEPG